VAARLACNFTIDVGAGNANIQQRREEESSPARGRAGTVLHGEPLDGRGNGSFRDLSAARRSVTCEDFWRSRCRFPTIARDRPLEWFAFRSTLPSRRRRPVAAEIRTARLKRLGPVREENPGAGRASDRYGKTSRGRQKSRGATKRLDRGAE
jgi:hypothetical protein